MDGKNEEKHSLLSYEEETEIIPKRNASKEEVRRSPILHILQENERGNHSNSSPSSPNNSNIEELIDINEIQNLSGNTLSSSPNQTQESNLNGNGNEEEATFTMESLSQHGNAIPRILQRQRTNTVWRRTIYLEFAWLFLTNILLISAISVFYAQGGGANYNQIPHHPIPHKNPHQPPPPPPHQQPPPPPNQDDRPDRQGNHPEHQGDRPYRQRNYRIRMELEIEKRQFPSESSPDPSSSPPPPKVEAEQFWGCSNRDSRISHWAEAQVVLQTLMLVVGIALQVKIPKSDTERITERRLKNIMSLYLVSRFSNLLWLVWALLGIIWTFESKPCQREMGFLFTVCFAISVIHLIGFCIPVLFCCCSLPVGFLIMCFCPSYLRRGNDASPQKASKKQIKKLTTNVQFEPFDEAFTSMNQFTIKPEDANCAICLGDYEKGEELRFLKCKHHFHGECIMEWLQQNKTCPMCKKPIDEVEENNKTDSSTSIPIPMVDQADIIANREALPFVV